MNPKTQRRDTMAEMGASFGVRPLCLLLVLVVVARTPAAAEAQIEAIPSPFPEKVAQFFSAYCTSCHGPEKQKGKLRIDTLNQDLVSGPNADDWHEVLDALDLGEMPPEDEKQPGEAERTAVAEFLTAAFKEAGEKRRSTGGQVVMRRLTNYEYNNTINDLLALDEDFSEDFPPDPVSEEGFKNNGFYMGMSGLQMENYLEAAKRAVDEAIFEGEWPELKSIDIEDVTSLTARDGKQHRIKRHDPRGILFWKDYPTEGPVVVDVALSGVKDFERIDRLPFLQVGALLGLKNGPKLSAKEVLDDPLISGEGELVHFRYRIPKIENYPQVLESHPFPELAIDFAARGAQGVKVVSMTAKGPYFEMWPPESHRRIFIPSENGGDEEVYAREILSNFMARAWRRPVTEAEVDELYTIYQDSRGTASFVDAIKDCLVQVLVSPDFLYLVERKGPSGGREKLNPYELSSRLSYFLWSSRPDEKLFQLASSGNIASPETLRAEVGRMLKDGRSWGFVEPFASQWLDLDRMNTIAVSPEIYPDFDEDLKVDMRNETLHFFAYILRENRSALNFIDSDFSFLSERLHLHYSGSRKAPMGSRIVKRVALDAELHRGGILSHASIHLANSDGEDSHVISRAVWLADKILGDRPPPPPADVKLDKEIEGFEQMSLKQQLAAHVEKESCARCHTRFDPFGVAFENYDAIGKFRTKVRKLDQQELDRRVAAAAVTSPELDFQELDASGDGYLQKDEWFAHLRATGTGREREPQKMEESFQRVSNARADKRGQTTHPKGTISLAEYKNFRGAAQRKALKGIRQNLPYLYVAADAGTVLPDATEIGGLDDLKAYLLTNKKDEFAENVVRRLLSYALGRSLEFSDDQIVQQLTRSFQANDYKLATLVEDIVLCDLFQTK